MELITLFWVCALQIAINILLYLPLKKFFEPAERRNPFLYFMLPAVTVALWGVIPQLLYAFGYHFDFANDCFFMAVINFLPAVLLTLLPPLIVYRLCFKKRVGEAYCVYTLSFFGALMFPVSLVWCGISAGV